MRKILSVIACFFALPAGAAECVGQNLIQQMDAARQAELRAAVADVPYHSGLFWQAQKGKMQITLMGTYHFGDPRHDLTMQKFGPVLDGAETLLVEAGPKEMRLLTDRMESDPSLLSVGDGQTLPERLTQEQWADVGQVLAVRGIPEVVASRMAPWYAAMIMGLSPCMLAAVAEGGKDTVGLDQMLMDRAQGRDIPIRALEPWDSVFQIFGGLTPQEEVDMVLGALPAAQYADDYAQTLIDTYFAQDVWTIWEFGRIDGYANSGLTRQEVDAQMALGLDRMIESRNESWIKPLTLAAQEAAKDGGYVVAGFGALHLPGKGGVLGLLEQDGWQIVPLEAPNFSIMPVKGD